MALSYFSNWERRFLHLHSSDMKMIPKTTELSHEQDDLLTLPDLSVIDQFLLDTDELFLTGNDLNSLLSDFSPPPPPPPLPPPPPPSQLFSTQTQQPFCLQQREYYHDPIFDIPNPKRHKPTCDYYNNCEEDFITDYSHSNPNFFNDPFLVNNSFLEPTFQLNYSLPPDNNNNDNMNFPPTQASMMPSFTNGPPVYCNGSSSSRCEQMNMNVKETNVSAQSIAARQRRRKITEKTQELGKLVPGGQKMNTAEMLQSAYKYIQFLQAQVGVLESMGSFDRDHQENEGSEELQCLLDSKLIQEKLYSTEKCLVPQTYVEELRKNHELVRINPELLARVKEECRSLDSNSYF